MVPNLNVGELRHVLQFPIKFFVNSIEKKNNKLEWKIILVVCFAGLGFRPISERTEEGSLIWYSSSNATQIKKWVARVDKFLDSKLK